MLQKGKQYSLASFENFSFGTCHSVLIHPHMTAFAGGVPPLSSFLHAWLMLRVENCKRNSGYTIYHQMIIIGTCTYPCRIRPADCLTCAARWFNIRQFKTHHGQLGQRGGCIGTSYLTSIPMLPVPGTTSPWCGKPIFKKPQVYLPNHCVQAMDKTSKSRRI